MELSARKSLATGKSLVCRFKLMDYLGLFNLLLYLVSFLFRKV